MDNRDLYESTFTTLTALLEKTIMEFSLSHDVAHNDLGMTPLFSIAEKLDLLLSISRFSNYQVLDACCRMCFDLCMRYGYSAVETPELDNVDFYIEENGKKTGYLLSFSPEYMLDLDVAKKHGITKLIVVVLKNNLCLFYPNSFKYRAYPDKEMIDNLSLKDFLNEIGPAEFDILQEYIGRYNYDAGIMLGLQVSAIPTKKALEKKKNEVNSRFLSYFYADDLKQWFSDCDLEILERRFDEVELERISNTEFANSFISSEWYYDLLVKTDAEMEQTAIVAGYLKSVEQFIFSIFLARCDKVVLTLRVNKKLEHEQCSADYVRLTKDNKDELLTMAGNLLNCIDFRKNKEKIYFDARIGGIVQSYLHEYVNETRNGYFHKDNLYNLSDIELIRKKSYCAVFLIASSFAYDANDIPIMGEEI